MMMYLKKYMILKFLKWVMYPLYHILKMNLINLIESLIIQLEIKIIVDKVQIINNLRLHNK